VSLSLGTAVWMECLQNMREKYLQNNNIYVENLYFMRALIKI